MECQEVQGRNCLLDFHGISFTRDRMMTLVKKWHSLIEASCEVKTSDGYHVRMFAMAFTKRRAEQTKKTCYAGSGQTRRIRKKMCEIMTANVAKAPLRDLVKKLSPESIGKEIEKACQSIFPVKDVHIKKVKIVKKPRFDLTKLMELHNNSDDKGVAMARPEGEEAQNTLAAEMEA